MEILVPVCMIVSGIAGLYAINKLWKGFIAKLNGKRFAVLGANTSGKTTMFLYLNMVAMEGTEIRSTRTVVKTGIGQLNLSTNNKTISFRFEKTKDLPGDVEHRNIYWKTLVKESDVVLYLINSYELLKGERKEQTQSRIKEDLKKIDEWLDNNPRKVIIIGNHFDRVDELFMGDKYYDYKKEFSEHPVFKGSGRGMNKIIASFKYRDGFEKAFKDVSNIIKAN